MLSSRPRRSHVGTTLVRFLPYVIGAGGIALISLGEPLLGALFLAIAVLVITANGVAGSPRRMIARLGGRSADAREEARLINIVERICVGYGVARPELRVLEDEAPNAIVFARTSRDAVLYLTSGALGLMDMIELEGLVAHELAHVKLGDVKVARNAMVSFGFFGASFGGGARVMKRLYGPQREPLADRAGVSMTRYPPGLIGALEKLQSAPNVRPVCVTEHMARLTGSLWCAPLNEQSPSRVVAGALSMELRIAALSEL